MTMANAIKDLAIEAAEIFGGDKCDKDIYIDGFTDGANAVIDKISSCLPSTSSFNPNEVIDLITSVIRELKA